MMEKFPDHLDSGSIPRNPSPQKPNGVHHTSHANGFNSGPSAGEPLMPILETRGGWGMGTTPQVYTGHRRHQSLSQTINHIRHRPGSVSQNAHDLADALKVPISPRLIVLCILWYWSSALTNTSSKSILNSFPNPATLTVVQFAFVAIYCAFFSWLASVHPGLKQAVPSLRNGLLKPSTEIIRTTLPLAAFQIGGHLLSSNATQRIPVSLVHLIKGLSPLFTVFAYRFVYKIRYPMGTYISLIPLTAGVMLACSGKHGQSFQGEFLGILFALFAAIIFVSQNIFSKKLFNEAAKAEAEGITNSHSLDKLNLLCYSSGMAFVLTCPIWFWSEGIGLLKELLHEGAVDLNENATSLDHGRLTLEFIFNGTCHFGQNIMAFVLLSVVSPVTYSVASLIKRVFVIVMAVIWFRDPTTKLQFVGIILTFFGLYLYDRSNQNSKADRIAQLAGAKEKPLLPTNSSVNGGVGPGQNGSIYSSPVSVYANGYAGNGEKKFDDPSRGRLRGNSNAGWLPPGTRQEETWTRADKVGPSG
ncbi:triose-phosphate transporter [Zalerion maritima]|uniref:Triose-phosphate transporter n=1 Tax=Zalerion maritima TaxID=339359 RepID=A0AAD5WPH9_9PEZI|nr:triose-phosphate transporter [Zalerion maritima]